MRQDNKSRNIVIVQSMEGKFFRGLQFKIVLTVMELGVTDIKNTRLVLQDGVKAFGYQRIVKKFMR